MGAPPPPVECGEGSSCVESMGERGDSEREGCEWGCGWVLGPCWTWDGLDEGEATFKGGSVSEGGSAGGFMRSLVPVLDDSTMGEATALWAAAGEYNDAEGVKVMSG
jgi:hypothetical protein